MLTANKVTLTEIREITGLSLSYLRALTRAGKLKGQRVGWFYIYNAGDVNRALGTQIPVRIITPDEIPGESLADL